MLWLNHINIINRKNIFIQARSKIWELLVESIKEKY